MPIGDFVRRARFLVRSRYFESELDEEIRLHIALRERKLIQAGVPRDRARLEALRRFGSPGSTLDRSREVWGLRAMDILFQDLAYSLRRLRSSPGFTIVAVLALALGIGATTAIFTVIDAVLLRSLPFKDPGRLAMVWEDASAVGFPRNTPAPANYVDWATMISSSFERVAALDLRDVNLTGDGGIPEKIGGAGVTPELFPVLGVSPLLGRTLTKADDAGGGQRVAVIGHALWVRRYAADPHVIGRDILVDGEHFSIVGVMPPRFSFPFREIELWVPAGYSPETLNSRGSHFLFVVARLASGRTLQQANAELATLASRLARDYPATNKGVGMYAVRLLDDYLGNTALALRVLLAAVGLVLLITCANLANVLLARGAARAREMAVRAAIGAGRGRLVRQVLTENVLLASFGGVAGLLVAMASTRLLTALVPDALQDMSVPHFDGRVFLFAAAVSVGTGVIVGLLPARQVARTPLAMILRQGTPGSGRRGGRLRAALVVAEVAGAVVLTVAATLMLESFVKLRGVDPGFRSDHLLTARTPLPETTYKEFARRVDFVNRVLARVRALPGVRAAGFTSALPLVWKGGTTGFWPEGSIHPDPTLAYDANNRVVSPGYMETMRMGLVEGRFFTGGDSADAPLVVIVNATLARQYWPGRSALGRRIKQDGPRAETPWRTVVGVVRDVRSMGLDQPSRAELYFPLAQSDGNWMWPRDLAVRADGDPMALANAIRRAVWAVDPTQPVSDVLTMDAVVDKEVVQRRTQTNLLGAFAALALLLACLGIYGVLSLHVSERTQEIGLRMALGAERRNVLAIVLGSGMRLAAIGVATGLVGALIATRVLDRLLFDMRATDPWVLGGVSCAILLASFVAVYVPARRASTVDPLISLRAQ